MPCLLAGDEVDDASCTAPARKTAASTVPLSLAQLDGVRFAEFATSIFVHHATGATRVQWNLHMTVRKICRWILVGTSQE